MAIVPSVKSKLLRGRYARGAYHEIIDGGEDDTLTAFIFRKTLEETDPTYVKKRMFRFEKASHVCPGCHRKRSFTQFLLDPMDKATEVVVVCHPCRLHYLPLCDGAGI